MKTLGIFLLGVLALLACYPNHAVLIVVCAAFATIMGYGLLLPLLLGRPIERDIF